MTREKLSLFRSKSLAALIPAAVLCLVCAVASVFSVSNLWGQEQVDRTRQEEVIMKQIQGLRQLPDSTRGTVTKQLALEIRQLPSSENKLRLATGLATLSTEGDPGGRETVQEVATTLAGALSEDPLPQTMGSRPYRTQCSPRWRTLSA